MGKTKRDYGIELLRIIAMSMIVMLHTLYRSGLLSKSTGMTYEVSWLLELFCYGAVDCFLIISGYVNLNNQFKLSRVAKIWAQVVFYLLVFEIITECVTHNFDAVSLIKCLFPFSTNAYWFYSYYFVLMFFMPFINFAVQRLQKPQCKGIIVAVITVTSVIPFVFQMPLAMPIWTEDRIYTQRGYSLIWFIAMYTVGAALRRWHDIKAAEPNKAKSIPHFVHFLLYAFYCFASYAIVYTCRKHGAEILFAASYTSPLIVLSAIHLFESFKGLPLGETAAKIIAFFSPGAFGVYLIHSNPDVFVPYKKAVSVALDMSFKSTFLFVFAVVIGIVVVTILIDLARMKLFKITKFNDLLALTDKLPFNKYFNGIKE